MEQAPDLTPPTKATKAPKTGAEPKAAKTPKEPKEAKERGPRKDYGYHKNATIELTDKETKYRGQRLEWFEILKTFNGKKVSEFNEATTGRVNGKGTVQTPSGWLRFYVLDGAVKLIPPVEEKTEAAA